jgi:hypothetical protein
MKSKILISGVAVLLALAVFVVPALAITNGEPDGDNHPYVVLLVFHTLDEDGLKVPSHRCSGSLLSETLVLTAGHCTDGMEVATIWTDAGPILTDPAFAANGFECVPAVTGYPCAGDADGTPHTNPEFCIGCGNGLPGFALRDVGVVVLDEPVTVDRYAELPEAGVVDTLENKTDIDFVGYGVQFQISGQGGIPPRDRWAGPRERMFAPSELVSGNFSHSDEFIKLALNASQGTGGTCFGDSGGPDLLAETDTVLAVNSYVTNSNCSGVGYSSRVDIEEVLDWINSF